MLVLIVSELGTAIKVGFDELLGKLKVTIAELQNHFTAFIMN